MSIADNVAISVVLLGIALLLVWLAFCAASLAEATVCSCGNGYRSTHEPPSRNGPSVRGIHLRLGCGGSFATSGFGFLSPKVNVVPGAAAAEKQIKKISAADKDEGWRRMKDGDGFKPSLSTIPTRSFAFWHRSFQDSASAIEGH